MKKTFLTTAFSLMAIIAVAQKKEIRNAGKALKKDNFTEAKALVNQAEASIGDAKKSVQADFYYTKALAYMGNESNHNIQDLKTAAEAMKMAVELGHDDARQGLQEAKNRLVGSAIQDQNSENYIQAAEKLLASYNLDTKDTLYLFYAASNYVTAKDYDNALKYYKELRDLGYSGEEMQYLATNSKTGEVESFSKENRDLLVSQGAYVNPQDKKSAPKTGEIAKNIAFIHIERGETEKAIEALEDAKRENPEDLNLLLVEADIYNSLGNMEKYKEIMEEVVKRSPDDPMLFYNLGISSANLGDTEGAIKYYNRALELDPEMVNAQINIASAILSKEQAIVDEMNSLGTSNADNIKYEQLKKERQEIYKEALPYLESAKETNPENVEVLRTLMNIYYQLNQPKKAEEMKTQISELEG